MKAQEELAAKGYSLQLDDNGLYCVMGRKPYRVGFRSFDFKEEAVDMALHLVNTALENDTRPAWRI